MKLQLRYELVETEEQAQKMVAREKEAHPRRKKHVPCYTPWNNPRQPGIYIVWYYI